MLSVVGEIKNERMPVTGSSDRGAGEPPETYAVEEAAKVLNRTARHVRRLLNSGALTGERDAGGRGAWRVYKWSTHALRDRLQDKSAIAIAKREPATPSTRERRESPESGPDLFRVIQDLHRKLGRVEGRLEISETAESTLRADLERERQRAEAERARADSERERAERERERANAERERVVDLEHELETERSRGFWHRLFGG